MKKILIIQCILKQKKKKKIIFKNFPDGFKEIYK